MSLTKVQLFTLQRQGSQIVIQSIRYISLDFSIFADFRLA